MNPFSTLKYDYVKDYSTAEERGNPNTGYHLSSTVDENGKLVLVVMPVRNSGLPVNYKPIWCMDIDTVTKSDYIT